MTDPIATTPEPSEALREQMAFLKRACPFRIVWGFDVPGAAPEVFASRDKRAMNQAARNGRTVFQAS